MLHIKLSTLWLSLYSDLVTIEIPETIQLWHGIRCEIPGSVCQLSALLWHTVWDHDLSMNKCKHTHQDAWSQHMSQRQRLSHRHQVTTTIKHHFLLYSIYSNYNNIYNNSMWLENYLLNHIGVVWPKICTVLMKCFPSKNSSCLK